jgi:hypothetical protein
LYVIIPLKKRKNDEALVHAAQFALQGSSNANTEVSLPTVTSNQSYDCSTDFLGKLLQLTQTAKI